MMFNGDEINNNDNNSSQKLFLPKLSLNPTHNDDEMMNCDILLSPRDEFHSPCSSRLLKKDFKHSLNNNNNIIDTAAHIPNHLKSKILNAKDRQKMISDTENKRIQLEKELTNKLYESIDFNNIPKYKQPYSNLTLVLGSSSIDRKKILDIQGWEFIQMSPDINEKLIKCDSFIKLPLLIAKEKATKLINTITSENIITECIIITLDSIVVFDGMIREKPTSNEEASIFLKSYSNNKVSTVSAIVATHYPSCIQASAVDICNILFNSINDESVHKLINKGEIFHCCGALRIEDEDLFPFVKKIEGTIDSIIGLPLSKLCDTINEVVLISNSTNKTNNE